MMNMKNFIELAGNAAEALGVLLILGGFVVAAARFVPLRAIWIQVPICAYATTSAAPSCSASRFWSLRISSEP